MAILSAVPPSPSTAIVVVPAQFETVTLTIPLDIPEPVVRGTATDNADDFPVYDPKPRVVQRRDSVNRREAMLKGKEGSRRRQRWENDNFIHNPHFVAPSAADWTPQPLHPKRTVRYEYASLWDPSNPKKFGASSLLQSKQGEVEKVPKQLKERIKKSNGAIELLRGLEEEVRRYAASVWGLEDEAEREEVDSEDEEIVFVSRNVHMQEGEKKKLELEKSVFEAESTDPGAGFVRWIIHTIAPYYGLKSWSVTTGNPSKRIAYVGISNIKSTIIKHEGPLPRPLWGML